MTPSRKNIASDSPVVLVTGASRGIGRSIALYAAQTGWSVAINYHSNNSAAKETRQLCEEMAHAPLASFATVRADVSLEEDRARLVKTVLKKFGRIDAVVHNAGVAPLVREDVTAMSNESYHRVMATNLEGPFFLTQLIANHWLTAAATDSIRRYVVFISSISAELVSLNRAEYCISKAGLAMAAQVWAARLAPHNIGVYEIRPGVIATDMIAVARAKYDALAASGAIPEARLGDPADVGKTVRAILEGDIPYASGSVIHLDGGLHIKTL